MSTLLIPAPRERETGDLDLERRVLNFLVNRQIPGLRELEVESRGGDLTIRGIVGSFYHKQLCINCCQRVAGVVRLIDELQVADSRSPN